MSTRHERNLKLAESQARKSQHPRWKVGAALIKGGRVVSMGYNISKNNPTLPGIPLRSCSVHAEASALRNVDAVGATLYVARVTRRNTWGMARPCSSCESLIRAAQVRRVVWTVEDNEYGIMLVRSPLVP